MDVNSGSGKDIWNENFTDSPTADQWAQIKKKKGNELELEDLSIKIIQSEGEREKRLKKINTHSVSFGTISNGII